ncbi:hypothetical protein XPA_004794 [Xanthoria parietina]
MKFAIDVPVEQQEITTGILRRSSEYSPSLNHPSQRVPVEIPQPQPVDVPTAWGQEVSAFLFTRAPCNLKEELVYYILTQLRARWSQPVSVDQDV